MKTRILFAISISLHVLLFCAASQAQFDNNKTFYERMDGGVTVVDPDRNILGNTEYKVRSYDSHNSAYQSEYAPQILVAQLGILAISSLGEAISELKDNWTTPSMPWNKPRFPVVTSVASNSYAASIGLQPGDKIYSYDGRSMGSSSREHRPFRSELTTDLVRYDIFKEHEQRKVFVERNGSYYEVILPTGYRLGYEVHERGESFKL